MTLKVIRLLQASSNLHQFLFPQAPILSISLISGQFHATLKESVISPLLKNATLDKDIVTVLPRYMDSQEDARCSGSCHL